MRKFLLGFSFLVLFCGVAFAQPSNDDCASPVNITALDGTACGPYNISGATFDLANGDCAPTAGSPNMWFSFVAQGPEVDITVNGQVNNVHVALLEFDPTPCDFASAGQIACGVGTANATIIDDAPLVAGNTYYLVVNLADAGGVDVEAAYQLCVINDLPPTAPPNDDACAAQVITPNGTCNNGTTVDATQEFTTIPGCAIVPENGVFYEFTVSAGNLGATIDLTNINLPGDAVVVLGEWTTNCTGNLSILDVHCGPPANDIIDFQGLIVGNSYVVFVGTDEISEGDFQLCVTEYGPPPGCSANNFCSQAEVIPGLSSNTTAYTCVEGCNILASPEPSLTGCNMATEEVVWYSLQTDANTALMSATVSSTDIEAPTIEFFVGGNCNALGVPSGCSTGAAGYAEILNEGVPPNTTIYIAVSNAFGAGGNFELCVLILEDPSACVVSSTLEVVATSLGSPLDGPFQPNETVSYCYTINEYTAVGNNCQWLQGVIPIFGDAWSPASFNAAGMPISSTAFADIGVYGGTWGWYTNITYNNTIPAPAAKSVGDFDGDGDIEMCHFSEPDCPNTGITAGQIVPPGWFAWDPSDGGASGNPNVDWGDGSGCGPGQGPWQICFDLTTLSFPECDSEDPQIIDTSVKIYTTADGETGSWSGPLSVCSQDLPQISSTVLNCCIGPVVDDLMDVVCPGGTTNITLTSDQIGNIMYQWTVQPNPNVSGYADGSGQFITQTLENNTTSPQIVYYEVTAISEEGCFGMPVLVPVTVLPGIDVDAGLPIDGCAQGDFELGGSPTATGGDGSFTYDWGNSAVDNVANPNASPNISTTYTVTVTDGNGCTSTDDVELTINPRFDVEITGDTILCPDLPITSLNGSPLGGSPNYNFQWEGSGTDNSTNQNLDFDGFGLPTGDYVLTLTVTDDNGCTGDQEVTIDIYNDPAIFIIPIPESGKFCPGGSIQVNAAPIGGEPGVLYEFNWTTPSGQLQNGASIFADETGWYVLDLIAPDVLCSKKDSIFIEEIQPPEPIASSPDGVCESDMVYITLDTIYTSYEWSNGEDTDSILVEPGTYSVTVTNEADCVGETSITVNPYPAVTASIGGSSAFCDGSSTTLSVSDAFATFEWTDSNGDIISTADTAFVTEAGNISVMVIDTNGCPASADIEIEIQDFLVPNILGDTSICPQACTDLNAGSGYVAYEWSTLEETQTISVCEPGEYSVTVYDAGGCTGEQIKIVTLNDLPTPSILGEGGEESFCPGGEIMLDAGAGYISYLWDNMSENQTIIVNAEGTYYVTVTDAEFCQGVAEIVIFENIPPVADYLGETTFCPGDSVTITPTPGFELYEIDLDNNGSIDVTTTTNDDFVIDVVGNSNIIVTDANGCTGEVIVAVDEYTSPAPITAIDTTSFCTDGNVILSITENFDEVDWYLDGVLQGSGQMIEVSQEGTYEVIVSDDNGCEGNTSMVVIESTQLFPFIIGDNQLCDNTPTMLDAGSGYETYDWGDDGDTQMISVSMEGTYTVTVFDAGGCSGSAQFVVTNSETPAAEVPEESFVCNNADGENESIIDLQALVIGANGFWEDTDVTGVDLSDPAIVDFTGVPPGFYTFTYSTSIAITPCEDQSYTMTLEVSECLCPSVTLNTLADICLGGDIVDLDTLKVTGEDGFWTVEQGAGNPLTGTIFDPSLAEPGEYVINFNLENPVANCDDFAALQINVIAPPNPGIATAPAVLCVGNDDVVNLSTLLNGADSNGTWIETSPTSSTGGAFDDTGIFTSTDQVVGEYTFEYIVAGTMPCPEESTTVSVIIGANPIADASIDGEDMLNCDLLEIEVLGTNSSGNNISFSWSESKGGVVNNPNSPNIDVTEEGTYVLEITDQFECIDVDSVIVTRNTDFPSVSIDGNDPFCANEQSGSLVANGTGGEGPYEYSLDGGVTWLAQNAFMNLGAGQYEVLVQDQNACTGEETITIEDPDEFIVGLGGDLLLTNVEDTLISLEVLGGGDIEAAIWTVDGSIVCEGTECDSYLIDLSSDREVCVIATNSFGCVDSTCVNIRSVRINDAYLGNSFTPNDDGENDVFYIQGGQDIEKVNFFRIYNRWGELVFSEEDFEPNNPEFGWKGRFKEKSVNPGVFAYTTEVLFKNGDVEVFDGDVTVIK